MRAEVERRHLVLRRLADGPVLDLSVDEGRSLLTRVLAGDRSAPVPEAGFRTVLSCAGFVRFPDLPAALAGVRMVLAGDGELLAVEPQRRVARGALAVASLAALVPAVRGVHLNRDVPAALRAHDLCVTDLERFDMATALWPLRSFVALRARPLPLVAAGGER